MKSNKVKNIFDWLNHISYSKTEIDQFTDQDWDKFNSYMTHRFISMYEPYAVICNELQMLNPLDKKAVYLCYKNILPKQKMFFKYIKSKVKQPEKERLDAVVKYFQVSEREAKDCIKVIEKDYMIKILEDLGTEEKEIKKIIKSW